MSSRRAYPLSRSVKKPTTRPSRSSRRRSFQGRRRSSLSFSISRKGYVREETLRKSAEISSRPPTPTRVRIVKNALRSSGDVVTGAITSPRARPRSVRTSFDASRAMEITSPRHRRSQSVRVQLAPSDALTSNGHRRGPKPRSTGIACHPSRRNRTPAARPRTKRRLQTQRRVHRLSHELRTDRAVGKQTYPPRPASAISTFKRGKKEILPSSHRKPTSRVVVHDRLRGKKQQQRRRPLTSRPPLPSPSTSTSTTPNPNPTLKKPKKKKLRRRQFGKQISSSRDLKFHLKRQNSHKRIFGPPKGKRHLNRNSIPASGILPWGKTSINGVTVNDNHSVNEEERGIVQEGIVERNRKRRFLRSGSSENMIRCVSPLGRRGSIGGVNGEKRHHFRLQRQNSRVSLSSVIYNILGNSTEW